MIPQLHVSRNELISALGQLKISVGKRRAEAMLMVCDKAYRLKVHKEKILPQYLVMLLNTSEVLNELEKLKSGISDGGLNLTQVKFLTLKIMVPTLRGGRATTKMKGMHI